MLNITIMCGGSGTRLWPLSRENTPKQFIKLFGEDNYTMFQLTCIRAIKIGFNHLFVICNAVHGDLVRAQLGELGITNYTIVAEPFGRNTAACFAVSCLLSPFSARMLVLASDHIWEDDLLVECVGEGLKLVNSGKGIVVFGITPTSAETGYGYLHFKGNDLLSFVEKPSKHIAQQYFESGEYLWNSGNFLFTNDVMLRELTTYADDILCAVESTLENSSVLSGGVLLLDSMEFAKVRDQSIDYAVMEHQNNGKVVKYSGSWSDIGSFSALYDILLTSDGGSDGNVVDGVRDVYLQKSHNCLVVSRDPRRVVAMSGVNDLVVVNTADSLLVCDRHNTQDVKLLINQLKTNETDKNVLVSDIYGKFHRPWGFYETVLGGDDTGGYKVKRITVYPRKRLSLQSHKKRSEHWVIVSGTAKVQVGEDVHVLSRNQSVYIPVGVLHRLENVGDDEDVILIETQIGVYLGEDDIVRYEDDFGRK